MHKIVNNKFYCLKVSKQSTRKLKIVKIYFHTKDDDDADADWVVKFVNIFVEKFWFETLLGNF